MGNWLRTSFLTQPLSVYLSIYPLLSIYLWQSLSFILTCTSICVLQQHLVYGGKYKSWEQGREREIETECRIIYEWFNTLTITQPGIQVHFLPSTEAPRGTSG